MSESVNAISIFIPSKHDGINGTSTGNDTSKRAVNEEYSLDDTSNDTINIEPIITDLHKAVYQTVCLRPTIKYSELADNIGLSEYSITRTIRKLKEQGYILRRGARKNGEWIILRRFE